MYSIVRNDQCLRTTLYYIRSFITILIHLCRYYVTGVTTDRDRNKLIICIVLILGSSIATAVYWALSEKGWVAYVVTVPIWFGATMGLKLLVPQARAPKLWGVPLVPWLPSASIAINIFLLGSIDGLSFARFGVWTGVLLLYYFFMGLHASYDTAKALAKGKSEKEMPWKRVEEGANPATDSVNGDMKDSKVSTDTTTS